MESVLELRKGNILKVKAFARMNTSPIRPIMFHLIQEHNKSNEHLAGYRRRA
jgi:hypothetical protein